MRRIRLSIQFCEHRISLFSRQTRWLQFIIGNGIQTNPTPSPLLREVKEANTKGATKEATNTTATTIRSKTSKTKVSG